MTLTVHRVLQSLAPLFPHTPGKIPFSALILKVLYLLKIQLQEKQNYRKYNTMNICSAYNYKSFICTS